MAIFRTLRLGSVGDDVAQWQQFLIGQGDDPGPADGTFSADTAAATREFQARHGLKVDGVVGPQTLGRALTLGLAAYDDDDDGHDGPHWPPAPPFPPLVSNDDRAAIFGRFAFEPAPVGGNRERIRVTDGWAKDNLEHVELPRFGAVRFHAKAAAQLAALWAAWESAGLLDRVLTFDGAYSPRFVRGSTRTLSNHAFGTAFDINYRWNVRGTVPALRERRGSVRELVELAHRHGFYWGGHFSTPDGMHFEVAKVLNAPRAAFEVRAAAAPRPTEAGAAFLTRTAGLSTWKRETAIADALLAGNTPPALDGFVDLTISRAIAGAEHTAVLRVAPDYLSIGTDADFVRIPMCPSTAQRVADARFCLLPTRRIVDAIYDAAEVRLAPRPMPDGRRGSNDYYGKHQARVEEGRAGHRLGALTAGHKKDIVVTPRLLTRRDRVAIYGWHEAKDDPIQPLSLVHSAGYVDYSHGVRLVSREATVDGVARDLSELLRDPVLSALVSDEGPVRTPRYMS